jgi:hypothetical protein
MSWYRSCRRKSVAVAEVFVVVAVVVLVDGSYYSLRRSHIFSNWPTSADFQRE